MSKPDPIVSEVSRLASEGQPGSYERAYEALQTGFDKFLDNERLCSKGQQIDQAKADQYWKDINNELSQRGFIPGLSVAYLNANFDRLDTQGRKTGDLPGPDGMLTHSEIRQEEGRNKIFARHFDQQEGKRDFFFEVAKMSANGNTRKVIERDDVDKYLRKQDKTNAKHEKQDAARESMAPLFQGEECDKRTLLEHINSKNRNGRVTMKEMEMYLDEYARRSNNPDSIYNQKNADYVQGILNGDESWNRSGDGFQINKLARKGNFDALNMTTAGSHEDLKKNIEAADEVFEEKVDSKTETEKPETKCEEIEEKTDKVDCVEVPGSVLTVRPREGYWHVAKRLLSLDPACKPNDQEIMQCMTEMMTQNSAHMAEKFPGYSPMLHPGDRIYCDLDKLCAQVPAARKALRR
ncbi:MAG: hypothetical protein IT342_23985 [Candidatus Melainabacteria bacterium]|nr:hypothetical protein [Candidatus Melainabacteria bacterium]